MPYPLSNNVSAGDPTLSAHYNNLRSDALNLGQPSADAVNLAQLLERYESRLTLQRLITDKIRVLASAAAPVSIMVSGYMLQATANIDLLDADRPAGVANTFYVFANRMSGSTTFTLSVHTSITEGANQRLLGRFYWNGTSIVKDSVRTELSILTRSLLYFIEPHVCEGRLTLSTGVPVPVADVASSANVYFTPYIGSRIALYVENYGWRIYEFPELTLNIAAVATNKNLDIWVYDNAGTLALDYTEWTNDTLRAVALVRQNGVLVKSGAPGYRYVGSVRTFNTGLIRDTSLSRLVWNYYNRVIRPLIVKDSTDSWTYSTLATWRALNNTTNNRVSFLVGVDETIINLSVNYLAACSTTVGGFSIGLGLDVTNDNSAHITRGFKNTLADTRHMIGADFIGNVGIGHHFLQIVEYVSSGIVTIYGDNAVPAYISCGGFGSLAC